MQENEISILFFWWIKSKNTWYCSVNNNITHETYNITYSLPSKSQHCSRGTISLLCFKYKIFIYIISFDNLIFGLSNISLPRHHVGTLLKRYHVVTLASTVEDL
jgi:hypothetical protein